MERRLSGVVSGVTLLVIRRSGEPWSKFGLRKFQPGTDLGLGAIAFLLVLGVYLVGSDALRAVLDLFYTPYEVRQLLAHHTRIVHPVDGIEAAMGVITMICVSFTEELVMRGYLIPRMEQLLRWTWCGVLVSAGVFAYGHLYQGIGGAWQAFGFGVVFGVVFVYTRRIWPLVGAHALIDIIAMLHAT